MHFMVFYSSIFLIPIFVEDRHKVKLSISENDLTRNDMSGGIHVYWKEVQRTNSKTLRYTRYHVAFMQHRLGVFLWRFNIQMIELKRFTCHVLLCASVCESCCIVGEVFSYILSHASQPNTNLILVKGLDYSHSFGL